MAESEGLERVVRIEKKVDALSISVDARFNEVRDHFVEQREYIEFAYDRLDRRISQGLARLEERMSEGFAAVDQRMSGFEARMSGFEARMSGFEARMSGFEERMSGFQEGLSRVERKLDQFFELQSRSKVTRRARPSKRRR
jgi:hypothetical protein